MVGRLYRSRPRNRDDNKELVFNNLCICICLKEFLFNGFKPSNTDRKGQTRGGGAWIRSAPCILLLKLESAYLIARGRVRWGEATPPAISGHEVKKRTRSDHPRAIVGQFSRSTSRDLPSEKKTTDCGKCSRGFSGGCHREFGRRAEAPPRSRRNRTGGAMCSPQPSRRAPRALEAGGLGLAGARLGFLLVA